MKHLNETVYKLTFDTNGVYTSYIYHISEEHNWPQVLAAFRYLIT